MSDQQITRTQALRAYTVQCLDSGAHSQTYNAHEILLLIDEHAAQRERIAELERERDLLRLYSDHLQPDDDPDCLECGALAAHDRQHKEQTR